MVSGVSKGTTASGMLFRGLERGVASVGRGIAWLTLAMVLVTSTIVLMRYGFNRGWIWLQESVTYLHAAVFMLAAAWALQEDAHVRVDIWYRGSSRRSKALVNLAGTVLFLVPFCVFTLLIGWDYVAPSWRLLEGSREAGGAQGVFLLKSLILAMPVLLLMQAACNLRAGVQKLREPAAPE